MDERIIAERLIERAEANEVAKVDVQARAIANRMIETYSEFLLALHQAQGGR